MGLAGASVGGRGAGRLRHRAGLPPGQAHQVGLSPTLSQPLMGEGVMELVWMEVGQAGLTATTPQHLNRRVSLSAGDRDCPPRPGGLRPQRGPLPGPWSPVALGAPILVEAG